MARSIPVLVPIPSSPRNRAPASVASAACRCSSPTSRVRRHDLTVLEGELDARHLGAAPVEGTSKRIVPLAECSCGPVKTSPLGMLRRPSELIQVRPATFSRRSVPAVSMWISRAWREPLDHPAWRARSARHAAPGRAGRGTARARRSRRNHARDIPACCASAGVGQIVSAQRCRDRAPRERAPSASPARDERGIDVGERVDARRRHDPHAGVGRLGLCQLDRRDAVELLVARVPVEVGLETRRAPAAAAARRRARARRGAARPPAPARASWSRSGSAAPAAPPGTSRRSAPQTRQRRSRRLQVREVLLQRASRSVSRTNWRSSAVAIR